MSFVIPGHDLKFEVMVPRLHKSLTLRYTRRMDTLALDTSLWDLAVDARGNWMTVGDATPTPDQIGPGMRLAQDVATRCLAWTGEVYYDTLQGIRYDTILGRQPNLALLQSAFNTEGLKVPLCQTCIADFTFTGGTSRTLGGTLTVSDIASNAGTVNLT